MIKKKMVKKKVKKGVTVADKIEGKFVDSKFPSKGKGKKKKGYNFAKMENKLGIDKR